MSMAYAIEREKPDAVLHLGDHTDDADDIRRAFPALTIYHVRGNNDFDMDVPLFAVVTVGGVRMYLTHGHRERVSMLHSGLVPARAREEGCSFAFFGHTHRMMAEREQGVFVCNPGSISLPRGGPASYARLDIEGGMVRTLASPPTRSVHRMNSVCRSRSITIFTVSTVIRPTRSSSRAWFRP